MDRDKQRLISNIIDLGELMLRAGAEVSRVEDTVARLGHAYGFARVECFTIIYSIVVTMKDAQGETYTETRRIFQIGTDMEMIRRCNALSRQLCASPVPAAELEAELAALSRDCPHFGEGVQSLLWGAASAAFTALFGGAPTDWLLSFATGCGLRMIVRLGKRAGIQNLLLYFLDSFFIGLLVSLLQRCWHAISYDHVVMGNIMLLIPGIALTTAVRDMIRGDLLSGTLELSAALLQAVAIAVGFAAAGLAWTALLSGC